MNMSCTIGQCFTMQVVLEFFALFRASLQVNGRPDRQKNMHWTRLSVLSLGHHCKRLILILGNNPIVNHWIRITSSIFDGICMRKYLNIYHIIIQICLIFVLILYVF